MTRGLTSEVHVYISLNVLILYFDPPASENTDRHEVQVKVHVTVKSDINANYKHRIFG